MPDASNPTSGPTTRLVFDEAWLGQCSLQLLRREGEITYCRIEDPQTGMVWNAARVPLQSAAACLRLERDYRLRLDPEWALLPVAFIHTVEGPLTLFPQPAIPSLSDLLSGGSLPIGRFLSIAHSAVKALAGAHAAGVVHGNLRPAHVLVESDDHVLLYDFRSPPCDGKNGSVPSAQEWPYLAPEQARPLGNAPDMRSDLYALGAIFYHALTGRAPLEAQDVAHWLHAHVAVQPPLASVTDPGIPEVLGQLLLKTMAKDPGARYQTAESLLADLAWCRAQWEAEGRMLPFSLGRSDPPPALGHSHGLVGRDRERDCLQAAFQHVVAEGRSRLVLVCGAAGAGKSALVEESFSGLTVPYRASGKSDLLQREIPYAPWSQIFRSLVEQLLGKEHSELEATRDRLIRQLNGRGQLLADLAPDVEMVTGPCAQLPDLPASLALARANRTLRDALEAFARPGAPLLLFLDDIQWADEMTLALLQSLLARPPRHVLLVLAYRDAEGQSLEVEGRLLNIARRQSAVPCQQIALYPLSVDEVAALLADNLEVSSEQAMPIAELVHVKTAGNPFFIKQVLRSLIDERIVRFDSELRRWTWSVEEVSRRRYADNVVELMIHRLNRLPPAQRELIRLAGCVGGHSEESLLAHLTASDPAQIRSLAQSLVNAGLLLHDGAGYSFPHDRVLEAAYKLTPPDEQPPEHARIALSMLDVGAVETHDGVFEVANQIQRACCERLGDERRGRFIALLIRAARRAKSAAAIEQAVGYLHTARGLLGDAGWINRYQQAFTAHWLAAECEMLLARLDRAQSLIDLCLDRARSDLDLAVAYRLQASLYTLHSNYEAAISAALEGLALVDVPLLRHPSAQDLDQTYQRVRQIIGNRTISELDLLPKADDERIEIAMGLLTTLISSFFVDDDISFVHLAKLVELTLLHGVTLGSCYGFAWFGVMIADRYGAYADGHAFGQVALALVERHGYEGARTGTLVAVDQVSPWTMPLSYALARAREAVVNGHAGGDLGMACYACNHIVSDLLIMGEHLPSVQEEVSRGLAQVRQFQYVDIERILLAQQQFAADLQNGRPQRPLNELNAPEVDAFGIIDRERVSQPTLFWSWLYSGMSAFYYGQIDYALRRFADAQPLVWSIPAHINLADYHLFHALAVADPTAPGDAAEKLERMELHRQRFVVWADINPATFRSKLLLIDGAIARLQGQDLTAIRCFDESGIAAAAAGFTHEQALAHEMLSEVCQRNGLVSGNHHHMRVARDCYRLWGAFGKVSQLEARHSFLASEPMVGAPPGASTEAGLDLAVGIKAARALSEEVLLDRLVETLMTHLMIHAGADHGVLMMADAGELQIAATGRVIGGEVSIEMDGPALTADQAPLSILNATTRTRKPLVLDDASLERPEAHRADLSRRAARSILCLPLLKQGTLLGLVYLENSLVPGLFSSQRLAILEILASQAAVSLETARLYARLIEENHTRAQMEVELNNSQAELARISHLTVMSELSASIAHEISQPLLGIVSNAAASLRWLRRATPEVEEAVLGLEDIRSDGVRAANIVQSLRSLAKQIPPRLQPVAIDDLIREVLRLTAGEIEKQGVTVETRLTARHQALADSVQIQQVVYNLVTNALEAMADIVPQRRRLVISSSVENGKVEVRFEDSGPGIPAEDRERIFDAFYTTKGNGMGMGLAICRSVIAAHGGTLAAEAARNGLCCIRFNLALAQ